MVDKLIAAGADVNSAFARLVKAVYRGDWGYAVDEKMLDKLIAAGADVNAMVRVRVRGRGRVRVGVGVGVG